MDGEIIDSELAATLAVMMLIAILLAAMIVSDGTWFNY